MNQKTTLPVNILNRFIALLQKELGRDTLMAVFEKANVSTELLNHNGVSPLDEEQAAQNYARLQSAMRAYYGRGARGVLLRIGSAMWEGLLDDAPFGIKAQSKLMRGLPTNMRLKPALEILAKLISAQPDNASVHTLDLDLLFVDKASAASLDQKDGAPICFVTQGLIREALYWASSKEFDIEETSCRAMGAGECDFKIITGVKP